MQSTHALSKADLNGTLETRRLQAAAHAPKKSNPKSEKPNGQPYGWNVGHTCVIGYLNCSACRFLAEEASDLQFIAREAEYDANREGGF